MHEGRPKPVDGETLFPARVKRTIGFVKSGRGAIEKVQHGNVDLSVAIVAGGIDQRRNPLPGGENIPAPKIAMKE